MTTIVQRLKEPRVINVYRSIINNAPISDVIELRTTLQREAPEHPRTVELLELIQTRLTQ